MDIFLKSNQKTTQKVKNTLANEKQQHFLQIDKQLS